MHVSKNIMANFWNLKFIFFLFITFSKADNACNKESKEKPMSLQIKEHILCDYDKSIRPIMDNSKSIDLEVIFFILHYSYNEYNNEISINAWIGLKWKDANLHWNPKEFGDVEHIFVTTDDIWVPDLAVYNREFYSDSYIIQEGSQCLIDYYVQVTCATPSEISGLCWPDLRYWPFDTQNCTIKIGSWYHTGEEINLNDTEVISDAISDFKNPEWDLLSVEYAIHDGKFKQFPNDTYPSIRLQLSLRRHFHAKFAFNLLPYLVLISMSLLTIWLDPNENERTYLSMVNIPSHILFLLNSTWELPDTANSVPYIILLLRNSLLVAAITLIETSVVRWLFNKTSEASKWLITSFSFIVNNNIGQLLLFSELNPEDAVENLTADDSANLVEIKDVKQKPKEWYLLGRLIDRVYFLGIIIFYFIMLIVCIPK